MNFREFFQQSPSILFDGAVGTQIYSRGIPKGHCYDELNLSFPETVLSIHQEYQEAGSQVLTTNTFGANSFILEEYFALGNKTREINYYGARLARQAAKKDTFVAGSVGPISRPLDTDKKLKEENTEKLFKEQIEALLEGGVDLIILETFACLDEIEAALQAAKSLSSDIFVIAEISFPNNGLTIFGKTPYEAGLRLNASPADVVGSNCGSGPQSVLESIKKLGSVTSKPLSAMPNAGLAQFVRGKFYYPFNPDYFARYGKKFLQAGVKIIGGCCGTTPEHIRFLKNEIQNISPKSRKIRILEKEEKGKIRLEEKVQSSLKEKIDRGGVISIEIDPPKNPDFFSFLKKIEGIARHVDSINVSDCPLARARMSPISTGRLIQENLGVEVIIHYTCRDRNILGIQSDLLGASALGLYNVLALGGDPPSIGDYPFATGVYDLTSEGLVEMLSALNHGVDILGNPLGKQTGFFIGVGLGLAGETGKEIQAVLNKIEKGAHFIISQPVFDLRINESTFHKLKEKNIPFIVSILPLFSFRNAEYFHYEVPGIIIPKEILARMENLKGREAEKEGIRIARELIKELQQIANGILLMPPMGKFYLAEEILGSIR